MKIQQERFGGGCILGAIMINVSTFKSIPEIALVPNT